MTTWTVGCDPEVFIVDQTGRPVPAHRFFPKKASGLLTYRDGYAVEFNPRPSYCRGLLLNGLVDLVRDAQASLPAGHRLSSAPAVKIDLAEDLVDAPADVLVFGCEPAENAYTGKKELPAISAKTHPYRYAGGHLHLGAPVDWAGSAWMHDPVLRRMFVRLLDRRIGVVLTYLLSRDKLQYARRRFYGKAGEMRYQTYGRNADGVECHGVEWRVPGANLFNHSALVSLALGIMRDTATWLDPWLQSYDSSLDKAVRAAINTGEGLLDLVPDKDVWGSGSLIYTKSILRTMVTENLYQHYSLPFVNYEMHDGWAEWCETLGEQVDDADVVDYDDEEPYDDDPPWGEERY